MMYARVQFRKPKMLNDSLAFSIYLFVLELIILLIMIRKKVTHNPDTNANRGHYTQTHTPYSPELYTPIFYVFDPVL